VIDLGSNSWRLVVFTYSPGSWWKRTDELYETVRIGAGLSATGHLSEEAIERGLETLSVFGRFCQANGLSSADIHPVATSAIRDASNRDEFVQRGQDATGLDIVVLSAEDEARYGYVAAVNTTTLTDGMVVELGGGSMQLVEVWDRRAHELNSFPLGAVRLTEELLPGSAPVKKKDLNRVRARVRETLEDVDWFWDAGERLVGMGGAARNLAAAAQRAGVARIVYLGGPLPHARAPSRHLASRLNVERILLDAIPASVALRASIVIGARSRSFRFMVRLIERMPVLALPAWQRYRTAPIDARDVISMLAAAAHEPAVGGRSLDIGGLDALTYGEMIGRIAELMLVGRPVIGLRVNATPIFARVAAAIAAEDPELVLPLMESLGGDLLPAGDRAAELLGVRLHSFDAAVEHALAEWEAVEPLAAR